MRATGSPPSGLSLKRAKPAKVTRNRPRRTATAWVAVNGSRNRRFRRTVSCPSGVLRSSAVSAMEPSRINRADDTTARRGRGRYTAAQGGRNGTFRARSCRETGPHIRIVLVRALRITQQKGRPEGRPLRESLQEPRPNQLAALLAGLSTEALSPFAGAVEAVDLMPCRRSSAIFRALSSLASGGT